MSSSRPTDTGSKDTNNALEQCRGRLPVLREIVQQQCKTIPAGAHGGRYFGDTRLLLWGKKDCEAASRNLVNQLETCNSLIPAAPTIK